MTRCHLPAPLVTIEVRDPATTLICTTTADGFGVFVCPLSPVQAGGPSLDLTALNRVTVVGTAVVVVDVTPPTAPMAFPINGIFDGTAEPLSIVHVMNEDPMTPGEECASPLSPMGDWSCTALAPVLLASAYAVDQAGNSGPSASITIDSIPPSAPAATSDGMTVVGSSEPNAGVEVRDSAPAGPVVCTAVADALGDFVCTLSTSVPDGTHLFVVAIDEALNVSSPTDAATGTSTSSPTSTCRW